MNTLLLKKSTKGLNGVLQIPGDKSISHRAVMFGAIAEGKTTIKNFLAGADCLSTISCFERLGIQIERNGTDVTVYGKGLYGLREPQELLDVGNSGTTIRLMMGILAGQNFFSVLAGDESIAKRPMTRVVTPLRQMGALIDGRENGGKTPVSVRGGNLHGITYELPVASAQVKSAVLLAGLYAEGTTTVIEPVKTRDHTERMISTFGGNIQIKDASITIEGGQELRGADILVPGDISSAAFFLVAGCIVPNSEIKLENVGLNESRTGIIDVLKQMGADVTIISKQTNEKEEPVGDIIVKSSSLKGIEIGGNLIPRLIDEIPIIALMATQAEGTTVIKDAKELKVKETNRIETVVSELSKLGANIVATDDGMIIQGKTPLKSAKVNSYGDHRIGMMLSIAALLTDGNAELENPEAVSVSYPEFYEHLASLMN
jgi:3-phosphoshikimate 1-carboxyvinyltransferase